MSGALWYTDREMNEVLTTAVVVNEVAAFEAELDALCRRYDVVLEHEDGHGSGLLRRPAPNEKAGNWIAISDWGHAHGPRLAR